MIEWRREHHNPFAGAQDVRIKLIGIGGTGSSVLDRIALDGIDRADLVAINTDVQSLKSSVAGQKVQLGKSLTCGLGAGGDPEVGYSAAVEAEKELLNVLDNVPLLFVCVGLGGGTGSGAAPVVVNLARQQGAFVVVFATLPFEFEGNRRVQQAQGALDQIYKSADCVICFENDRLGENILPRAGIHKAFSFAEQTISQSVRAIAAMVNTPGLIEIGFDELLTVMRNHDPRCLFGYGEAEGEARASEALADALRNPLMDKGRLLSHADSILVNIMGGEDLTLSEVQKLMRELNQHINENTHVLMGSAIDKKLGSKLSVTLISSLSNEDYSAMVDRRSRLQQSGSRPNGLPGYSPGSEEAGEAPRSANPGRGAREQTPGTANTSAEPDEEHQAWNRSRVESPAPSSLPDWSSFSATEEPEPEEDQQHSRPNFSSLAEEPQRRESAAADAEVPDAEPDFSTESEPDEPEPEPVEETADSTHFSHEPDAEPEPDARPVPEREAEEPSTDELPLGIEEPETAEEEHAETQSSSQPEPGRGDVLPRRFGSNRHAPAAPEPSPAPHPEETRGAPEPEADPAGQTEAPFDDQQDADFPGPAKDLGERPAAAAGPEEPAVEERASPAEDRPHPAAEQPQPSSRRIRIKASQPKPPAPSARPQAQPNPFEDPAANEEAQFAGFSSLEKTSLPEQTEEDSQEPEDAEETARRGRFQKYEPTIINGEDYDVPTFMRKHVKLK
jgi:cell division protein FtsZ